MINHRHRPQFLGKTADFLGIIGLLNSLYDETIIRHYMAGLAAKNLCGNNGLIRKMPNQCRYLLTVQGQTLTTALNAILAASTQQLVNLAA